MTKRYLIIIALALLPFHTAWARPVSYPGGWTVIQTHNRETSSALIHYTPSADHSVGLRAFHIRSEDTAAAAIQVNVLMKRLNSSDSQANFYFKWGAGAALKDGKVSPAGFAGISSDMETRRFSIGYENRVQALGETDKSFWQSGRVGIAPYLADSGSLHTWLMVKVDHYPGKDYDNDMEITPLVRFFKGASLIETGYSFSGKLTLNFIRRF